MMTNKLWTIVMVFVAALAMMAAHLPALAEAPRSIRIGYAISLTGPNAVGAAITQLPIYRMWVDDVNAEGGIMLSAFGKRLPIDVIEYDDESTSDGALRALERLITQDKVDFVLAPWGTGLNLAVAPYLNEVGYPHLITTAATDGNNDFSKRWPASFWMLGSMRDLAETLVNVLAELRAAGKIGNKVAMVSVADQFGIMLSAPARRAFKKAKFELVYDRAYPVGSQDMRPILAEVMQTAPDAFVAFSYPPDTMLITEQSRDLKFNPKVFYTSVGTAYPSYRDHFRRDAEGVMGPGGWNADSPESKRFLRRHLEKTGLEPDRWGGVVCYSTMEMLQQAIERVGRIDRAAVIKELQTGTFQTMLGPIKLERNERTGKDVWFVGQWQNGEFHGLAPTSLPGAHAAEIPKPAWGSGG